MRRVVIAKKTVDDALPKRIFKYRRPEDLRRVKRGRRRQRDFGRVKIVDRGAILALEVALVSVFQFVFGTLFVERIAAVRLVDDD